MVAEASGVATEKKSHRVNVIQYSVAVLVFTKLQLQTGPRKNGKVQTLLF